MRDFDRLRRLCAKFRNALREPECQVCGLRHGPLMTLDINGRLTTSGAPRHILWAHYATQLQAMRELSALIKRERGSK